MFNILKNLSRWCMPRVCTFCKTITNNSHDVCLPCRSDLPILQQGCVVCANVLTSTAKNLLCGECLRNPPFFERIYALFNYQPPIIKLILDLKFQHALNNARLLGELLTEQIQNTWYLHKDSLPSVIIPIPLHVERLKERGFNQAIEIARPIAKTCNLPLLRQGFIRVKPTRPQATLSAKERKHNMHQAFLGKIHLEQQHVAVVDDVITTGSTIHEFCRVLKKHGAGKISVWCCARRQK